MLPIWTRTPMTRPRLRTILAITALSATLLAPGLAAAQSRDGNFLDNLFSRGEGGQQQQAPRGGAVAQADDEISVRIDRLENALRQLTGTIEQLQYQNQQLQAQMQRMQGGAPQGMPQASPQGAPMAPRGPVDSGPAQAPGRRGDLFDPNQQPNAPGAPRPLGQTASAAPIMNDAPVGAPGGREPGAPLDLSSLSGNGAQAAPGAALPPQQPAAGPQGNPRLATLPPSAKPQDEYDLAYGYILHKDYGLAEQAFNDFLRKYPNEALVPDANYWLGEAQFQQQRYSEAAKAFLVVITKHERAGKAPDSLLRLGQSLAALNKKEAACATLAEVGRKYPKASASLKRNVAAEQKRVHC
jgi:tol-pal system protein YbgF